MSTENCRILDAISDRFPEGTCLKADLRKEFLKRRQGLSPEYCRASDKAVLERILEMEAYRKARVVFTYVSRDKEVDTRKLLEQILSGGKTAAVPRCVVGDRAGGGIMKAYEIKSLEDLEPEAFGILEPKKGCREIGPKELELVVAPCVACSEEGVRLGYGGGYYDRYLAFARPPVAVLCRERLMCSRIPREVHDCRADYVVTEKRALVLSGSA